MYIILKMILTDITHQREELLNENISERCMEKEVTIVNPVVRKIPVLVFFKPFDTNPIFLILRKNSIF